MNTRINILQWILTKLGTYLVLKRIWNVIDFKGQWSRSQGQIFRRGDMPCFALPLLILLSVNYFRLVAEKINKNERKNKAEIHMEYQAREERAFWRALGSDPDDFIGVGQILESFRS